MPVLSLPGTGGITQYYGEYPTSPSAQPYADPGKEAVRRDLMRLYGDYQSAGHDGVDLAANLNDPIYAWDNATILYAGWETGLPRNVLSRIGVGGISNDPPGGPGGLVTYFQHDDQSGRYVSYCAHGNETLMDNRIGGRVNRGELVMRAGTSGRSGGVHIHWAVIDTWAITNYPPYGRIDPLQFVGKVAAAPARELLIPDVGDLFVN